MTRNPNISMAAVSDPIKVALLTDDPLLRTGLTSLLAQNESISVVDDDAEVALWDAGVDPGKTLTRLGELLHGVGGERAVVFANPVEADAFDEIQRGGEADRGADRWRAGFEAARTLGEHDADVARA